MNTTIKHVNYTAIVSDLRSKLAVQKMYNALLTVVCIVLMFMLVGNNNRLVNKSIDQSVAHATEYQELNTRFLNLKANSDYLSSKYQSLTQTIDELIDMLNVLDEQNQQLVEEKENYYNELCKFQEREELFNKYEYAIYNKAGKRTDITYEQLIKLEELTKESKIQDEDFFLSIIMTESAGVEKARSTSSSAKGYGQFIDGTSRYVYTKLMNKTNWSPNVALDGDINIEMVVAYLDDLYEKEGGDIYNIIRDYRGLKDIKSYVKQIDSYLQTKDKSVSDISKLHQNS